MSIFPLQPTSVRFIRMGPANAWAKAAIADGEIVFGDAHIPACLATNGDWDAIRQIWIDRGQAAKAGDFVRELRDFHRLDETCLWITFYDGLLWWAFGRPDVKFRDGQEAARARLTIEPWNCHDSNRRPIRKSELSSYLTKTSGYPGTICGVDAERYLLRRINGEPDPDIADAERLEVELADVVLRLITRLDWRDFEVLADRLAEAIGWRRQSMVGGSQAAVDFVAEIPALRIRGHFQVKAKAHRRHVDAFLASMSERPQTDRRIFVCHTLKGRFDSAAGTNLEIWTGRDLAVRAMRAGLYAWVVERSQ